MSAVDAQGVLRDRRPLVLLADHGHGGHHPLDHGLRRRAADRYSLDGAAEPIPHPACRQGFASIRQPEHRRARWGPLRREHRRPEAPHTIVGERSARAPDEVGQHGLRGSAPCSSVVHLGTSVFDRRRGVDSRGTGDDPTRQRRQARRGSHLPHVLDSRLPHRCGLTADILDGRALGKLVHKCKEVGVLSTGAAPGATERTEQFVRGRPHDRANRADDPVHVELIDNERVVDVRVASQDGVGDLRATIVTAPPARGRRWCASRPAWEGRFCSDTATTVCATCVPDPCVAVEDRYASPGATRDAADCMHCCGSCRLRDHSSRPCRNRRVGAMSAAK